MKTPSLDLWMQEAKASPDAAQCGMYLFHRGVVRQTARAQARQGAASPPVSGMVFSHDARAVSAAIAEAEAMPGIHYVRVWLNEGALSVGDDLMQVLVGGDIRPHVIDALQALVDRLKSCCVTERELFAKSEIIG